MTAERARYIWVDEHGTGRNVYALFRRRVSLGPGPHEGTLHLFADTRYRLLVNGHTVGHGPARFAVSRPEYDTWHLGEYLCAGENIVAIVVNNYGCSCMHAELSIGGLIAWGQFRDSAGEATAVWTGDGEWKGIQAPGFQRETPKLSFALNPGEVLDARKSPSGWAAPGFDASLWPSAVPLARQEHWGELHPRSIPPLDEQYMPAVELRSAWKAFYPDREERYSFVLPMQGTPAMEPSAPALAMTYLYSPRPQTVTMGAFWGVYWLNGERLQPRPRRDVDLRRDYGLQLHAGWNVLMVSESTRHGAWEFVMGLPAAAGIQVSAERAVASPNTFLLAGPWPGELQRRAREMALPLEGPEGLPEQLGPWGRWPRDRGANSAYVEMCWKHHETMGLEGPGLQIAGADYAERVGDASLSLIYDFGTEVLGRPMLEFEAAAGTKVDLAYSEMLQGGLPADHGAHHIRMAERYIAREGEQTVHTFHPRGFRYLQVTVSGDLRAFRLREVGLTRATYPARPIGEFECSDPLLNRIWTLGRDTQLACMEDAYLDCPRRERGCYAGDMLVQFYTNLAAFGDTDLMRRCVELFFLAQGDEGLLPPAAHGLEAGRHPDYSAIMVQALWHYYARTGDMAFLRRMKPHLVRLMGGLGALEVESADLLDGSHLNPYLDRQRMDRRGITCALNCFYQRAFHDAARIMGVLDDVHRQTEYAIRAQGLAEAIRREFWDATRQVFVDRRVTEVSDGYPSAAANTLPLLYDIAAPPQVPGALEHLRELMRNNFQRMPPRRDWHCNVMPYFSFYSVGALCEHGRTEEALQFIRECWGLWLRQGAWTCWETWPGGSRCHAWSSCPTHYLSSRVLGVRFPEPGRPDRVLLAPEPGGLEWARGTYPHARGPLRVEWRLKEGRLSLTYEAPQGVEVTVDEAVQLTHEDKAW